MRDIGRLWSVVNGDGSTAYKLGTLDWVMRIDDSILNCVVFVGYEKEGRRRLAGTGFFLAMDGFLYMVTAAHVVDGIRHRSPSSPVLVWANGLDGLRVVETDEKAWISHPDDPTVDAAICQIAFPGDGFAHSGVVLESFVSPGYLSKYDVGVGDELYFPGLFSGHHGRGRLVPIVRQGTVAAMAGEPVSSDRGDAFAHLAEVRSIGGFSGSPVFLHFDFWRTAKGMSDETLSELASLPAADTFFGLVHGHFDLRLDRPPMEEEVVNMGVSIVVPAEKVLEVVTQPRMEAARMARREPEAELVSADDVSVAADFTDVEVDDLGTLGVTRTLLGNLMQVPKDEARDSGNT